jgi:phosphatidylglycerophosphatase A
MLTATAGGAGLAPVASGTFGTLVAVLIHLGASYALPPRTCWLLLATMLAAACVAHAPLVPWAEERWGDDPSPFVLDEVAGYLLVAVLYPSGPLLPRVAWGFFAFRFFDILKPPPARQFDRDLPGARGVLLDDLAAGLYSVAFLYALHAFGGIAGIPGTLLP